MTSKSLSTLLVLPLGFAVAGCPGDDSSGTGTMTATDTVDPTTNDPTSMTESSDPTTETESSDPTTETESSDPTTETESSDPTTDTDPTDTTGEPPEGMPFFRFSSMYVRDPHFMAQPLISCTDLTDSDPLGGGGVNGQFNEAITTDTDMDGNLDLSLMLLFRDDPIMQADGGSGDLDFANGTCLIPFDATVCDLREGTSLTTTTYTSSAAGPCENIDPTHLSGEGYTPAPGTTPGPCFSAGPTNVTIVTTSFDLPLENAEIAATYMGDPVTGLMSGTLRGFLSVETAESIMLPADLAMQVNQDYVSGLLPGHPDCCASYDDRDEGGTGWWFYVDFEAVPVPWNGP